MAADEGSPDHKVSDESTADGQQQTKFQVEPTQSTTPVTTATTATKSTAGNGSGSDEDANHLAPPSEC